MVPKQPGHAVINVLADQQQLARRTLEAAMNPLTNIINSNLANPMLNPFAGLFGLWTRGLVEAQQQQLLQQGQGQSTESGVKSFATIYANGGVPKVRISTGDYDIDEVLMAAQSLLEQIRDQQYNPIRQAITQLLDWEAQQEIGEGTGTGTGTGRQAQRGDRSQQMRQGQGQDQDLGGQHR